MLGVDEGDLLHEEGGLDRGLLPSLSAIDRSQDLCYCRTLLSGDDPCQRSRVEISNTPRTQRGVRWCVRGLSSHWYTRQRKEGEEAFRKERRDR